MSVQRRPRIPEQQAHDIDLLRGREPFESYVREAINWYIEINGTVTGKDRLRTATGPEKLMNLIASDFWNGDHKVFKADVAEALRMWGERLDEFARDEEHEE